VGKVAVTGGETPCGKYLAMGTFVTAEETKEKIWGHNGEPVGSQRHPTFSDKAWENPFAWELLRGKGRGPYFEKN